MTWPRRVFDVLTGPVILGLALAAAVLAHGRSGSFWLAAFVFVVALAFGDALRRFARPQPLGRVVYRLLWPGASVGVLVGLLEAGLPNWAAVLCAIVGGGVAQDALARVFLPRAKRAEDRDWLRQNDPAGHGWRPHWDPNWKENWR